jgi:hypothetical protein
MQATEPFCMMLKEVKERRKQLPWQCLYGDKKNTKKILKHCLGEEGAGQLFTNVHFLQGPWNVTLVLSEGWV